MSETLGEKCIECKALIPTLKDWNQDLTNSNGTEEKECFQQAM